MTPRRNAWCRPSKRGCRRWQPHHTDRLFKHLLNALPETMETDQGRKSSDTIRYALEQMHLESV